ncbi:MAG: hypothetical protein VB066_10870 [Paludibacter sp.]|nr:hypothetical protein [Paludibacter sp.]
MKKLNLLCSTMGTNDKLSSGNIETCKIEFCDDSSNEKTVKTIGLNVTLKDILTELGGIKVAKFNLEKSIMFNAVNDNIMVSFYKNVSTLYPKNKKDLKRVRNSLFYHCGKLNEELIDMWKYFIGFEKVKIFNPMFGQNIILISDKIIFGSIYYLVDKTKINDNLTIEDILKMNEYHNYVADKSAKQIKEGRLSDIF